MEVCPGPADEVATAESSSPAPGLPIVDPLLFLHAALHRDLEQQRVGAENRLRILTTTGPDEDGITRGFGLPETHPDVAVVKALVEALADLEHRAELQLKKSLRRCALHPWIKAQKGLGEKQAARLLAAVGDPYWNARDNRARTVGQLWAYCGLHVVPAGGLSLVIGDSDQGHDRPAEPGSGVAARRRKGQQANWSADAKTRAYLCATSFIKQPTSPWRGIYDARRDHTALTHPDWTLGHGHADGLRYLSKRLLRELWREARRLHQEEDR